MKPKYSPFVPVNDTKRDTFTVLEARLGGKVDLVVNKQVKSVAAKLGFESVMIRIFDYLNIKDKALMGGTSKHYYREFMRGKFFSVIDFTCIKATLSSSTIFSKISYSGDHLTKLVLPAYLKQTDYKK